MFRFAAKLQETRLILPMPLFGGWETEDGLRPAEGPTRSFGLPVVRWAQQET